MAEARLLAAARGGDERAFARLSSPYRRELQVHCYRMLGSVDDAEDLVQETMLRAWRRLATFEGRTSLRRWLYTIATNACLNLLERQPRVVLFPSGDAAEQPALARVSWLEPYPDTLLPDRGQADPQARLDLRESVALAFLAAIQHLPARQRAMLLLFDVLGWSVPEVAGLLDTSIAAVNSGLQRARAKLETQPAPRPTEEEERALVERFVEAWDRVDIEGIVELLREDAVMAMPPEPVWFDGRDAVGEFSRRSRPNAIYRGSPSFRPGPISAPLSPRTSTARRMASWSSRSPADRSRRSSASRTQRGSMTASGCPRGSKS
jgi:RNA polymerase sigma-70 factor (ECF subfamily)